MIFLRSFIHTDANPQTSIPGKIALATDVWTSTNGHAFLSLVASWVTEDWKVAECVVDFAKLHGSHDGKNLASAIFKSMEEKNLAPKVSCIQI